MCSGYENIITADGDVQWNVVFITLENDCLLSMNYRTAVSFCRLFDDPNLLDDLQRDFQAEFKIQTMKFSQQSSLEVECAY